MREGRRLSHSRGGGRGGGTGTRGYLPSQKSGNPAARAAAIVKAAEAEGVPFALNARTDAFVRGGNRSPEESLADAIARIGESQWE